MKEQTLCIGPSRADESARCVRVCSVIKRRACGLPDAAAEIRSPARFHALIMAMPIDSTRSSSSEKTL